MQILYGAQMSIFRAFHNGWPMVFFVAGNCCELYYMHM